MYTDKTLQQMSLMLFICKMLIFLMLSIYISVYYANLLYKKYVGVLENIFCQYIPKY